MHNHYFLCLSISSFVVEAMIIKIVNADTAQNELCLLEFQGELVGDLAGNDLGSLKIVKVWYENFRNLCCRLRYILL